MVLVQRGHTFGKMDFRSFSDLETYEKDLENHTSFCLLDINYGREEMQDVFKEKKILYRRLRLVSYDFWLFGWSSTWK